MPPLRPAGNTTAIGPVAALNPVPFKRPSLSPKIGFNSSLQRICRVVIIRGMFGALGAWSEY